MKVRITYEWYFGGGWEMVEIPFVVGVISDFAGKPLEPLPHLLSRKFVEIDSENFDAVLSAFSPRLQFEVENKLENDSSKIDVELNFKTLSDFAPDNLVQQIKPLREFAQNNHNLNNQFDLDQTLSAQLNEIIHHQDFKNLEASWRGLYYLVSNKPENYRVKIRIMNVTKKELRKDFERSVEFYQSAIFKKIHDDEYGAFAGQPYGALIGNYEFSHHLQDIFLLKKISQIAATAHTPFIAAASPGLFQTDQFSELNNRRFIGKEFSLVEYSHWNKFRESEEAKYVSLCVPHFLLREKYGEGHLQTKSFQFIEEIRDINDYLWGNSAFAFGAKLTQTFDSDGWCVKIDGSENGLIRGFSTVEVQNDDPLDEPTVQSPIDLVLMETRIKQLSQQGFNVFSKSQTSDQAVFLSANSCAFVTQSAFDESLPVTFAVSRIVQHLKMLISFEKPLVKSMSGAEWERFLNRWVSQYCAKQEKPCSEKHPLADAHIEVMEDKSIGNGYLVAKVYLKLCYQFSETKAERVVILDDLN